MTVVKESREFHSVDLVIALYGKAIGHLVDIGSCSGADSYSKAGQVEDAMFFWWVWVWKHICSY